jgi:hypothetical protein
MIASFDLLLGGLIWVMLNAIHKCYSKAKDRGGTQPSPPPSFFFCPCMPLRRVSLMHISISIFFSLKTIFVIVLSAAAS